ncbi:hypothetical protein SBA1_30021 [Candidatus Sulfotelmatobacter kueseliae]|uniref:Uncharacterized protein n=1 Tax=Candidatus Sulfotelmatobacter kueseliae TaxID=2042962 RepID=A0A2U3KKU6_9BACT|nr:hypothetical protein SBA1_30021 [Candidatus Sulfotelmatobacter kueseliae]
MFQLGGKSLWSHMKPYVDPNGKRISPILRGLLRNACG